MTEEEQDEQLKQLYESEHRFAENYSSDKEEANADSFQKSLANAKRQLKRVGRPLCRQLKRLASPQLMASIENELLAKMGEAANVQKAKQTEGGTSATSNNNNNSKEVTCQWKTANLFKAYTEKITLEALCRYHNYRLNWAPGSLSAVEEKSERSGDSENEDEEMSVPEPEKPSSSTSTSSSTAAADDETDDDEAMTIEIYSKRWRWPPVRLANVFYLNKN